MLKKIMATKEKFKLYKQEQAIAQKMVQDMETEEKRKAYKIPFGQDKSFNGKENICTTPLTKTYVETPAITMELNKLSTTLGNTSVVSKVTRPLNEIIFDDCADTSFGNDTM